MADRPLNTGAEDDPHAERIDAIAARFGVARADVVPVALQGEVNLTLFLGSELVLRLPRNPRAEQKLAREAAVIPVVRAAGVPTPAIVAYDTTRTIVDIPYLVQERQHGPTLAEFGYDPLWSSRAHASLAPILATLHSVRLDNAPAPLDLPEPSAFSTADLLRRLCEQGELGSVQAAWMADWFARLEARRSPAAPPVLTHGDILPTNLIVDPSGAVIALLDWGSVSWGDRAQDLVDLPPRALPRLIRAYARAVADAATGDGGSFAADALWFHLFWGLARLAGSRRSSSEERNWSAPRQARMLELLRFVGEQRDPPWSELTPGSPLG